MSDDPTDASGAETPAQRPDRRRRVVALIVGLVVVAGAAVGAVALFDPDPLNTSPSNGSAQPGRSPFGTTPNSNPPVAGGGPASGPAGGSSAASSRPGQATAATNLTPFAPSDEKVFSNGTVKLGLRVNRQLDVIGWFAVDNYGDGHIVFTDTGLAGQNGTEFALLGAGADTSFTSCRNQTAWSASVGWNQLRQGSFACLRTVFGRRGIIRVDEMPDLAAADPATVITGSVWEAVVDR